MPSCRFCQISDHLRVHDVCMPTRLVIQPSLSPDALEERYRAANDHVARRHWHIVWRLGHGLPSEQVPAVTGYTANGVRTIAPHNDEYGPTGVGDRHHRHPGSPGLLSGAQYTALARVLDQPPPDDGRWTGPKVAAWMATALGRPVHPQWGWEVLRRLGLRPNVPRLQHAKADPAAQAAAQKSSPARRPL